MKKETWMILDADGTEAKGLRGKPSVDYILPEGKQLSWRIDLAYTTARAHVKDFTMRYRSADCICLVLETESRILFVRLQIQGLATADVFELRRRVFSHIKILALSSSAFQLPNEFTTFWQRLMWLILK